ncbi:MAG: hypothetical protein OK438_05390 [Thaumarchaeota archaeon]|nr:hypothetical protein [Nitrososphaerota archaeon]
MIRQILVSGYNRTFGWLKNALWGLVASVSSRGGLLQVAYVLLLVGLMAGFTDAVAFPTSYQGVVYPGSGAQTISEAVLDAFVILLGGAGIYLTYVSGRQTTRSRAVNMYLGLALIMIAVSLLVGIDLAILKGL